MTKRYQNDRFDTSALAVPEQVGVAMEGIALGMREGLLALAVGAGLQVMAALMDADVAALAGPRGRRDPGRVGVRHGTEAGSVTLGGRRVARSGFSGRGCVRLMAGLSTRRYGVGLEPVGRAVSESASASASSKSSVSRRFVAMTETALGELLGADLSGLDLVALMVDGVHLAESCCIVALGVDSAGVKHPLALVEGSTENATLVTELCVGLRERGLEVTRPVLVVLDGSKPLRRAVLDVFDHPVIARRQLHKLRNVRDHLPQRMRPAVERRMRAAYHAGSALEAEAALTVLARTLRSTNAIESMISICRERSKNVKRWRDGRMALRGCAAGMVGAKTQFRRIDGHLLLPALRAALDRHVADQTVGTDRHDQDVNAA